MTSTFCMSILPAMNLEPSVLKSLPLFLALTDNELQQLCDATIIEPYRKGEYLIREGAINHFLFFLVSGSVRIQSYGIRITRLTSGNLIGEVSIAGISAPIADVIAREEILTYKFPINIISKIAASNATFASDLYSQAMGRVLR